MYINYLYNFFNNYLKINFIYLLIIMCSFKLFGYVVGFAFLIPSIFYKRKLIIENSMNYLDNQNKLVISYFVYLIIQSFIGAYTIQDLRVIIYWVTFFIIAGSVYLLHNKKLKYDLNYKNNLQKTLFKSSAIYFSIFFIINIISFIFFGNAYDIQNNFWVGGSTSFNISSIFLYILFYRWSKISFKLNSWFTLSISSYTFLVFLNDSRLGQLYLFFFLLFTFLKSFKTKNLLNGILIILICFSTFTISHNLKYNFKVFLNKETKFGLYNPLRNTNATIQNIFAIPNDISNNKASSHDTNRALELKIGLEKLKSVEIKEKIFGTGWYSSRITINNIRNKIMDQLNIDRYSSKNDVSQLQGIVSLLIDTGLSGFIFTLFLFLITIKNTIKHKSEYLNKCFYLSVLITNFFCLFIGYPWINIPFILMLMPRGLFFIEEFK